MTNLKLNETGNSNNGNNDLPNISSNMNASKPAANDNTKSNGNDYIKDDSKNGEERKLFANKKANTALIILGVVIVVAIVGLAIFAAV